jgi:hypothetical protein
MGEPNAFTGARVAHPLKVRVAQLDDPLTVIGRAREVNDDLRVPFRAAPAFPGPWYRGSDGRRCVDDHEVRGLQVIGDLVKLGVGDTERRAHH